jgi:hypothetical protein
VADTVKGPYGAGARIYRGAGWLGVLPLPPGRKYPPPGRFTGWAGIEPSGADVQAWIDGPEGAGNIALRLPVDVYGLDVDAYGGKGGAAALAELEERCGPLPPTWTLTSRDDGTSGIRLYRASPRYGRRWRDQPSGSGAGIEAIHRGHRYAVTWPSVHPETGRKYVWFRPDGSAAAEGEVPGPGDLTELPAEWIEALSQTGEPRTGDAAGHHETVSAVTGWREGGACERVRQAHQRALGELRDALDGAALHPAATRGTFELVSLGHEGHAGARAALAEHYSVFVEVRSGRGESGDVAEGEWWRLVRGAVGKLAGPSSRVCDCELLSDEAVEAFDFGEAPAWLVDPAPAMQSTPVDETPAEGTAETGEAPAERVTRIVDLGPWLDGSWRPPEPSAGAIRDDGARLLYPGRWHNCDGLTESGKSWKAIVHARDEMINAGRVVAYLHLEEELPGGTVARLLVIGIPPEVIRERFRWLSNDSPWEPGEMAATLAGIENLGLLILDGRNAACEQVGLDPSSPQALGWFKRTFVAPGMRSGAAVLSLGHPVKAKDRQDERHGFGYTGWLDQVDGVAFRLVASKDHPISRGASGAASLYVVKDRYGEVSRLCMPDNREGWRFAGSVVVDDSGVNDHTTIRISTPTRGESGAPLDVIDTLAGAIVTVLSDRDGSYPSDTELRVWLRADGIDHDDKLRAIALERLERAGRLIREPAHPGRPRPGRLATSVEDQNEGDLNDHP